MSDETTQLTLAVNETKRARGLPTTILFCRECEERILRSRALTHADDHDALRRPRWANQFVEPTEETVAGGDE